MSTKSNATQDHRLLAIQTGLGKDKLLLHHFSGTEELSRLFEYQLELYSPDKNISPDRIIGSNVTIRLDRHEGPPRFFNGFVSRFAHDGFREDMASYRMVVVPWLWFLKQRSDCRIFQDKTVQEILEDVFRKAGFRDFEFRLKGLEKSLEYCVQYRETDFDFISRLCEQYGIFYFHEHENGKHKALFTNSSDRIQRRPKPISYRWNPSEDRNEVAVYHWHAGKEVRPGMFKYNDFDFENPKSAASRLLVSSQIRRQHAASSHEIYDAPGEYAEHAVGTDLARVRIEELQSDHELAHGSTNDRGLFAGELFELKDCPLQDQNREYLVRSATCEIRSETYFTEPEHEGESYSASFTVVPKSQAFRPARRTPKPFVKGPQTAIVAGPEGEEIYTDKYGRVKVQFHWDRYGKSDADSSCWVRVAHPWAGKNWGFIAIPRIGQEVVVEFLEGDPDRPIIVGSVYNGDQMPPYELPENKTQSGIKTRSSLGGGSANFNEIRFEDKKGEEEVYIHAEKTLTTVVEGCETRTVGGDRTTTIRKNETLTVREGDRSETLEKGSDSLEIQMGDRNCDILQGNDVLFVQTGNIEQSAPAGTFRVDAKDIALTGFTSIKLSCGASSIELTPASITLKSPLIRIN